MLILDFRAALAVVLIRCPTWVVLSRISFCFDLRTWASTTYASTGATTGQVQAVHNLTFRPITLGKAMMHMAK